MFLELQISILQWLMKDCDTEDGCWKFSFLKYFLKMLKQKTFILNCNNISQYYCFYCIFDQINAALVSI